MLPPPRLAATLMDAGLSPEEIPGKLALFAAAASAFDRFSQGPPVVAWWAPGRIEVFGKHTDYAGGESLLAAVPRGFVVLGAPRSDARVRVADAATGARVDIAMEPSVNDAERMAANAKMEPSEPEGFEPRLGSPAAGGARDHGTTTTAPAPYGAPSFARYVRALTHRLARNFPGAPLGADLAFASDLPQAAGLSSSSALTVGLASALLRLAGIETRPEWRAAIRSLEDRAGYFACLENGADFGPLAGAPGVGALTGSEDQTAILGCRAGRLSRYSFLPVVRYGEVPLPSGWRFVIATSGVVAAKAGNARERYNRAALGVATLLELWNREAATRGERAAPSLAAALASGPEAEARLRARIEERGRAPVPWTCDVAPRNGHHLSPLNGVDLETRLTHFLRENPRAALAEAAFRQGDAAALGDLAHASQRDAEELLGNQIPETSALVELARAHGACAASAFGGGFGGAVWALVAADDAPAAEDFARRWLDAYRARFPRHEAAEAFLAAPGPGLVDLRL